jgi:hypothetical protein
MLAAIVDAEGEADELRQDGRTARPDLDDLVAARLAGFFGLLEDVRVDKRTFPTERLMDYRPFFLA